MKAKLGVYLPIYGGWNRGVMEKEQAPTYRYVADTAKAAEEMGIQSIWVPDHMLNPIKGERKPSLEAWTTLTAIAAGTKKVELFHTTLCQGFRYPAVLAKMSTTLDDVSDGRFRFALGAGWFQREFQSYGAPWYDHDTKIDIAREQIQIIKSLWTKPTTNFKGQYYEIVDGILAPKPIQKPHPPVWWGGESEKSRRLAFDLADGWLMSASTVEEAEKKVADMKARIVEQPRGPLMYAIPGQIYLGETDELAKEQVKRMVGVNENLYRNILARHFVGSPETIVNRVEKLEELGFDYIIFQPTPALKTLKSMRDLLMPQFYL